jgi:nitrite reductase (NADH) small subunit
MVDENLQTLCVLGDLIPGTGMAALVDGEQVAVFYLPREEPCLYAIDNFDPVGGANVLARGIVGDINGELVVASPLYKDHFSLSSGRCIEKDLAVRVWQVMLDGERVLIETAVQQEKRYA